MKFEHIGVKKSWFKEDYFHEYGHEHDMYYFQYAISGYLYDDRKYRKFILRGYYEI